MKTLQGLTFVTLLSAPAFAAPTDTMMVRKTHTDAYTLGPNETPAKDTTQTIWLTKDRVRVDSDENTVILRLDDKKMYLVDPKSKTYSTIELPFDMKKYLPPEMGELYDKMKASSPITATVTVTDEKKKIHDWTSKKFQLSMQGGMGGGMSEEIWTTTDIAIDTPALGEMMRLKASMMPGGEAVAEEMKKITGIPVMTDRTQSMGPATIKTHEELVSVEQKDAPAGAFDVPKDYTEKPFDPMSKAMGSGPKMKSKGPPPGKQP